MGGLARRATIIAELRMKNPNTLLVDAGNWAETKNPAYNQEISDFIFFVMQRLKYDAVTLGVEELRFGVRHYEELSKEASAPAILVNNVRAVQDGQRLPVGTGMLIREVGGVRVGVFGLVSADNPTAKQNKAIDYALEDSVNTAKEVVGRLREEGCEIIVLLAQLAPSDVNKVIRAVPGIDVAILGFRPGLRKEPSIAGETIIVRTGFRGQYFGLLELEVDPYGEIVQFNGMSIPVSKKFEEDQAIKKLVIGAKAKIRPFHREEKAVGRVRSRMNNENSN